MRFLFTVTLFLSSALLFLIQPMIAKMILPRFGGSAGVWNTSMMFFQGALLVGYGYAHLSIARLGARRQSGVHVIFLLLTILTLPIAVAGTSIWRAGTGGALEVLVVLALTVGIPFVIISAGAPLIQRWFASTNDRLASDPYFLYAASNVGSMVALLAYPTLIEPRFTLDEQTRYWGYGFYLLVALMAVCAVTLFRQREMTAPIEEAPQLMPAEPLDEAPDVPLDHRRRLKWIGLAFVPSSLMLGVTTFLTSNLAPIPLLWIVPLALYLLTFILAFARRQVVPLRLIGRVMPLLVIPLGLVMVLESTQYIFEMAAFHLIVFFVTALMCHSALAQDRPHSKDLTQFFFLVSLGGVLGGIFNALIAPAIFHTLFEYPLVLAMACAFRPKPAGTTCNAKELIYPIGVFLFSVGLMSFAKGHYGPSQVRTAVAIGLPLVVCFLAVDRPVSFGLALAGVFTASALTQISVLGEIIEAHRSFYGLHRVMSAHNDLGVFHTLTNGNTVHGLEFVTGKYVGVPLTYYAESGPIGQVFKQIGKRKTDVALVGLGVGSLAAYGRPGQNFTYYELDPDVVRIARDPAMFTFLRDCRANLKVEVGDARLTLEQAPANSIDLLVLDAFSSDSIPVHLLTKEAFDMYLRKLRPGGVIAVHISNRYLDLEPILAKEASSLALVSRSNDDTESDNHTGKAASHWIIMARSLSDLSPLDRSIDWNGLLVSDSTPLWTDDYSNLLGAFKKEF